MTKHEKTILYGFCQELSDRFGNDGCNDYTLENTPENRALVKAALEHSGDPDPLEDLIEGDTIWFNNMILLDYLADKMLNEQSPDDNRQG